MMNELGREGKERGRLVRVHCLDSGELDFGGGVVKL